MIANTTISLNSEPKMRHFNYFLMLNNSSSRARATRQAFFDCVQPTSDIIGQTRLVVQIISTPMSQLTVLVGLTKTNRYFKRGKGEEKTRLLWIKFQNHSKGPLGLLITKFFFFLRGWGVGEASSFQKGLEGN